MYTRMSMLTKCLRGLAGVLVCLALTGGATGDDEPVDLHDFAQQRMELMETGDFSVIIGDQKLRNPAEYLDEWAEKFGCKSNDLEISAYPTEPDNIWELRADPETSGRYEDPTFQPLFRFNNGVDPFWVNLGVRVTGELPSVNGKFVDCSSPEADGVERQTYPIWIASSRYMLSKWLIFRHKDPFYRGCTYTIRYAVSRYNDDGQCLPEIKEFQFTVAPDSGSKFQRETENVRYDLDTGQVLSFDMKPGVQVELDEMWLRYKNELAKRDWRDEMVLLEGYPKDSPGQAGGQYSRFQQEYRRIPVIGGGFLVHEQDGYVRSASGRFIPNLNVNKEPELSAEEAWGHALFAVAAEKYPWDIDPNIPLPEGRLVVVSEGRLREPGTWRLAWRFLVPTHKPFDYVTVDIDAHDTSGKILNRFSNSQSILRRDPVKDAAIVSDGTSTECTLVMVHPYQEETIPTDAFSCVKGLVEQDLIVDPAETVFTGAIGPPVVVVKETNPVTGEAYIYDHNSDGRLDGCGYGTCNKDNPPHMIERYGSSIFWRLLNTLSYVVNFASNQADLMDWNGIDQLGEKPVYAILGPYAEIQYPARHVLQPAGGDASSTQSESFLFFSLDPPDKNPAVALDIVAHEFGHAIRSHARPSFEGARSFDEEAIEEGVMDVFGTLVEFHVEGNDADWCVGDELELSGCTRNLATPTASVTPMPTTYGTGLYKDLVHLCHRDQDPTCEKHRRGFIVGRAFYLMANGGSGTNDYDCEYDVSALDADPAQSRLKTAKIVWKLMTETWPSSPDFYDMREATRHTANILFPVPSGETVSPEEKTVKAAWDAVGVRVSQDVYFEPTPTTAISPWPAEVNFEAPEGQESADWQIQLSSSRDFDADLVVKDAFLRGQGGQVLTSDGQYRILYGADFNLKPNKRYYWRFRPKSDAPWSNCHPIQSLKTRSVQPEQIEPVHLEPPPPISAEGIAQYAPLPEDLIMPTVPYTDVTLDWGSVSAAAEYWVSVSTDQAFGCPIVGQEIDTDESKVVRVSAATEGTDVDFELQPETEYFWWVRAVGPDEIEGDCHDNNWAQFKTSKALDAPEIVVPQDNISFTYKKNNYPIEFRWRPVEDAEGYKLSIYAIDNGQASNVKRTKTDGFDETSSFVESMEEGLLSGYYGFCWQVLATRNDGEEEGPYSPMECTPLGPSRPDSLRADNVETSRAKLVWHNEYTPGDFRLIAKGPGGATMVDQILSLGSGRIDGWHTYELFGLSANTTYSWQVIALATYGSDKHVESSEVSFTTAAPPEPEPEPEPQPQPTQQTQQQAECPSNHLLLTIFECTGSFPDPCISTGTILDPGSCYPVSGPVSSNGTCAWPGYVPQWHQDTASWICIMLSAPVPPN